MMPIRLVAGSFLFLAIASPVAAGPVAESALNAAVRDPRSGTAGAGVGVLMLGTGTDSKAFAFNVTTVGAIVAMVGYIKHRGASDDLQDLRREGILRGYSK